MEYSRLGGTADSADFQGPIARPVSDDFRHFFTQIATEYDADHPNSDIWQGIHLMRVQRVFTNFSNWFSYILNFPSNISALSTLLLVLDSLGLKKTLRGPMFIVVSIGRVTLTN